MTLWLAGQTVTVGKLNSMLPLFAYKTASTSRTSTTTLAADPDLTIAIATSQVGAYALEGSINFTGALIGSGDLKLNMTYSGTVTNGVWMGQGSDTTAITNYHGFGQSIGTSTQTFGGNGGNFAEVTFSGMLQVSTSGNLVLNWAQNTSATTATTVRLGSWLKLTRMDL